MLRLTACANLGEEELEMTHEAYLRKETLISMLINGVLSLAFFLLVFGRSVSIPVWGLGNWVFDYLPQSFMITLMSTLVPGALTAKRVKSGTLQPAPYNSRLPHSVVPRALVLAVITAPLGTIMIALASRLTGLEVINWTPALILKVVYGVVLGAVVTPIGLRAALRPRKG